MNTLQNFIRKNGGYARMKDLKEASFHPREIAMLTQKGVIEKIKPGVYRLSEISLKGDENFTFVDIYKAFPWAVICLTSALYSHNLTTFCPSEVYVAVPHNTRIPKIEFPPIRVFYFNDKCYQQGLEIVKAKFGEFRIYCVEKTICDMFKFRGKMGEDLAVEGLKNYISTKKGRDLDKLMEYADICRVKIVMAPYVKAMLG